MDILCSRRQISEILASFISDFRVYFHQIPFSPRLKYIVAVKEVKVPPTKEEPPNERAKEGERMEVIVKWRRQIHPCCAIKVIIMERYYFVKVTVAPAKDNALFGGFPLPKEVRATLPCPLLLGTVRIVTKSCFCCWDTDVAYLSAQTARNQKQQRWFPSEGVVIVRFPRREINKNYRKIQLPCCFPSVLLLLLLLLLTVTEEKTKVQLYYKRRKRVE